MVKFEEFYRIFLITETTWQKEELRDLIKSNGFRLINEWFVQWERELKQLDEADFKQMEGLLTKAKDILPAPEQFSPLWKGAWESFQSLLQIKQSVYEQVPEEERLGEWQVLIDNPSSTDGITTHAHLTFAEAAYLYAKYRRDLNRQEWITLQRVKVFRIESGERWF